MVRSLAERLDDIVLALDRVERRIRTSGIASSQDLDDESLSIVAWSLLVVGEAVKALQAEMTGRGLAGCATGWRTSTFGSISSRSGTSSPMTCRL